jgi:hypothetical protein
MRWLMAGLAVLMLTGPATAARLRLTDLASTPAVLHWISDYHQKPDPAGVPTAMVTLSKLGAFNDTEHCGAYVGFLAGVLAANSQRAPTLIARSLAMKPADRWLVVRAIAYSGLPNWQALLRQFAHRVPSRRVMINDYIDGKLPRLAQFTIPPSPTTWDRMSEHLHLDAIFGKPPAKLALKPSADVINLLWGYYFGTGSYGPVMHLVALLAWSQNHDDVERLVIGSMAKYTLASNAMHDQALLAMLRDSRKARGQPKVIVAALKDVIDAAETVDTGRVHQEALAAIDELRSKGPAYKRAVSWWGFLGQTAVAGGCLAAATTGQVEFGLPCVVGGATGSALLNFWNNQP